jgi:hypothetical protein
VPGNSGGGGVAHEVQAALVGEEAIAAVRAPEGAIGVEDRDAAPGLSADGGKTLV